MADRTIKVTFLGDATSLKRATDSVSSSLGKVSREVQSSSSGVGGAFSKLTSSAKSATEGVSGHFSRMASSVGSSMAKFAKAAAIGAVAAVGGLAVFGKSAISAASDLSESQAKVGVVFGDSASEIDAWAGTAARAFGQSKQQALEAAGTYGNLFQAFGVGRDESKKMSTSLVELAADLASFNNTSVDDALGALQSGLSGETEPLKRFGVAINDARLKEEALRLGLIKTTKDALTPGAKAQAAYALIMKDTALAQGDFARTSDGLANRQRILKARFEDIKAEVGTKLLPVMVALAGFVLDRVLPAFERLSPILSRVVSAVAGAFKEIRSGFSEGVNSEGFAGRLQKLGDIAHTVFRGIRTAFDAFIGGFKNPSAKIGGSVGTLEAIFLRFGAIARQVFEFLRVAVPKVLQAIGAVIKQFVIPAVQAFAKGIQQDILPAVRKMVEAFRKDLQPTLETKVIPALKKVGEFIVTYVIPAIIKLQAFIIGTLLPAFFKVVKFIAEDLIPALVNAGEKVGEFAKKVYDVVAPIVAAVAEVVRGFVGFGIDVAREVGAVITKVAEFVEKVAGIVKPIAAALGDIIADVAGWNLKVVGLILDVVKFFREAPGKIIGFFADIGSKIAAPFIAGFNLIADAWNATIGALPSFSIGIPGLGTVSTPKPPRMPKYDDGGLVRGGAIGNAVEAIVHVGETVLPTHRMSLAKAVETVLGPRDTKPDSKQLPMFDKGGVVKGGPIGKAVKAILHVGETVLPTHRLPVWKALEKAVGPARTKAVSDMKLPEFNNGGVVGNVVRLNDVRPAARVAAGSSRVINLNVTVNGDVDKAALRRVVKEAVIEGSRADGGWNIRLRNAS